MPEIVFKGKEYVYNHHLSVPYRPLVVHPDKGVGAPDLGGNLIIHGDNLAALKSLLPRYAGKVDLVFIDPPYNTGNEGWCYSDNVNSPIMREWLSSNPVDGEDMLRHDKWLCMMWPRLMLLPRTEGMRARYQNPDNDPRGPWLLSDLDARAVYSKGLYAITTLKGRVIGGPPTGKYWRISEDKFKEYVAQNRIWWGVDGNADPNIKRFLSEVKDGVVPRTIWRWQDIGRTRNAKTELLNVRGGAAVVPERGGRSSRVARLPARAGVPEKAPRRRGRCRSRAKSRPGAARATRRAGHAPGIWSSRRPSI